jgi:hypothetical protein
MKVVSDTSFASHMMEKSNVPLQLGMTKYGK